MKAPMEWAKARLLIELIKRLEEDIRPHSAVAAHLLRMTALEIYEVTEEGILQDG